MDAYAPPPFRADPFTPDPTDGARVAFVKNTYHAQDDVMRPWEREVEDSVKMLAGLQWTVFNQALGQYVDVTRWMDEPERRWRQRPVINRMLYWFMLTHARMTENQAIVGYLPATADQKDSRLAQVADPIGKYLWRCGQMHDVHEDMTAWLIAAGSSYIITSVDPNRGDWETWQGPAMLQLDTPQGPIQRVVESAPYDQQGNPLVQLNPDGSYSETGAPHVEREGEIMFEVPCPLQVRGEWGPKPWYRKSWHAVVSFDRVADIKARYGIDVTAQHSGGALAQTMELTRLMFGSGWFGSAASAQGSEGIAINMREGRAPVYRYFEAPVASDPQMRETDESPGGRMIVVVGDQVAYDGPRPARFPYTSPIERFDFVKLPGRNSGTTPLEMQKPLQRSYNRGGAQLFEHRNLQANPMMFVDTLSGVKAKSITNKPGLIVYGQRRGNIPPIDFVNPPPMPSDVWRIQEWLKSEMQDLGNIEGAEGRIPSQDASGELVTQLRNNADRFLGPALRRAATSYARIMETAFAYVPVVWPKEKVITVAGEDQAMQTIMLYPELFEYGKINVIADIDSMLPESRVERQRRVQGYYESGIYGQPGTPEAAQRFAEEMHFPNTTRALLPGGVDMLTARDENKRLFQGMPAQVIPPFEWYDDAAHLVVHERFMKSTEFLELPPPVQQQFMIHWMYHQQRLAAQQQAQMEAQIEMQQQVNAASTPPKEPGRSKQSAA